MYEGQQAQLRGAVMGDARDAGRQQSQAKAGEPSPLGCSSERLRVSIAELTMGLSELEKRLDGVLIPSMTNKGQGATATPEPVRCSLGAMLDTRADEVYELGQRIRELLGRLAL